MADDSSAATKAVGPYLLQRTLGKGQTGLVKLGVHCVSRKTVAVKIINREKLSNSVLMKVEREIAIMKLIDHPHVLGLYDVYESNSYLYLVLEHVSGGELFDYLVKKGRLSEREARRFFRQIVSAVDFCHKHKVCHRDLKPENLLLDEHRNIKVADFGMASLQVGERLLETSCGSPHYACPEVIRGEHYDGRKADTWSCGVILYALLVGALPFDDDNLRVLLEKVKRGTFHIPPYIPPGAQQLLRGMVDVNPKKRLSLDDVMRHSWFRGSQDDLEPVPPLHNAVQTTALETKADIDPDVFKSMTSLGCFRDKQALINALLSTEPNEEKVVYFLLLSRKERQPSVEDEAKAMTESNLRDPPRKRVDSRSASASQLQQQLQRTRAQSIGSANLDQLPPRSPRLSTTAAPSYATSSQGYYMYSAATPPSTTRSRKLSHAQAEVTLSLGPGGASGLSVGPGNAGSPTVTSGGPGSSSTLDSSAVPLTGSVATPWKRKLSQTMRHLVVSPRFHRKRYDGSAADSAGGLEAAASPQMVKRSWFANFRSEKDKDEVVVVFRDKGFTDLRLALMQAFKVVNCQYEELDERTFKVKYESSKQKGKHVFKKAVKLTITLNPTQSVSSQGSSGSRMSATGSSGEPSSTSSLTDSIVFDGRTFTVTFAHVSGATRRFRRVCDKLQSAIWNPSSVNPLIMDGEHPDSGINPSLSSDDTLTTASPILGDTHSSSSSSAAVQTAVSTSSKEDLGSCSLLGGYSTDDCESEDGLDSNHVLGKS